EKKDSSYYFNPKNNKINVALIYPSQLVGRYAKSSINTILGYLNFIDEKYNLIAIDTLDESLENMQRVMDELEDLEIKNVVALFTPESVNNLKEIKIDNFKIYFPLIEKKEYVLGDENLVLSENIIFGAISYSEQLKKLSQYSDSDNVLFYLDTYLGNKLKHSYDELNITTSIQKDIKRTDTNFKDIVKDDRLNDSFIFLNLDIVKSSLILSQLRANEIDPKIIFATQVLYDPILMTLTQDKDRERLLIANSIDRVSSELKDNISNFGGNISYEWVDYSTLVGVNYLLKGNNEIVSTKVENNQAIYIPKLYISTAFGFVEIK
ncbi:hypothetical protein Q6A86_05250, partial [Aliarcobacter skirrowii]|uniref:hypothetical protein n=1 Tax=Aliarcobacter skirrowii TaxID=28200 RepID=UPI0029A3C1D5